MKRGFTIVELIVVVGMIMVLIASMTTAVGKARTRAKIAKATQEAKEMTNAILAFENYARDHSLDSYKNDGWGECTEGSMKIILGGETGANGERVPVLFNAAIRQGSIRDPWGNAYQYMIKKTATLKGGKGSGGESSQFLTGAALPNFNRMRIEER